MKCPALSRDTFPQFTSWDSGRQGITLQRHDVCLKELQPPAWQALPSSLGSSRAAVPAVSSLGSFRSRKGSAAPPCSVQTAAPAAFAVCRPRPCPGPWPRSPQSAGSAGAVPVPPGLVHAGEERTEPPPPALPGVPFARSLDPGEPRPEGEGAPRARGWRGGRGGRAGAERGSRRCRSGSGAGPQGRNAVPAHVLGGAPRGASALGWWEGAAERGERSPFQGARWKGVFQQVCGPQPTAPLRGLAKAGPACLGVRKAHSECSGEMMPIGVLDRSFFPLEHRRYLDGWGGRSLSRTVAPLCPSGKVIVPSLLQRAGWLHAVLVGEGKGTSALHDPSAPLHTPGRRCTGAFQL